MNKNNITVIILCLDKKDFEQELKHLSKTLPPSQYIRCDFVMVNSFDKIPCEYDVIVESAKFKNLIDTHIYLIKEKKEVIYERN